MKKPSIERIIDCLEPLLADHFNAKIRKLLAALHSVRQEIFKRQLLDSAEGRVNDMPEIISACPEFHKYLKLYLKYLEDGPSKLQFDPINTFEFQDINLVEKIQDRNLYSDFSCIVKIPSHISISGLIKVEDDFSFRSQIFESGMPLSTSFFYPSDVSLPKYSNDFKKSYDRAFRKYERYYRNEKPKAIVINKTLFNQPDAIEIYWTEFLCHFFVLGRGDLTTLLKKFTKVKLRTLNFERKYFTSEPLTRQDLDVKLFVLSTAKPDSIITENEFAEVIFINTDYTT